MATLTTLRNVTSQKLGLDNTVGGDQPLLDGWANEAVAEVLTRSRVNVVTASMTLTGGSYDYVLPPQILALDEIFITDATSTVISRMNRMSAQELLNMRIGTQLAGAPPVRFYALNGTNLLMVYPTPTQADTVTIYYVPRPAILTIGSDTPSDIPVEWHKTVEYYMCWQGGQYINDAASQNGNVYRALYEDELAKLKKGALHRGGRKLSPAVVGRRMGRATQIGQPSQQDV